MALKIKSKQECRWDMLALGEIMLRFDPGDKRIWTTRIFRGLRRRRRIQRRAWSEALLRPRYGRRHRVRGQSRRPAAAGSALPGRRGPIAGPLGSLRWRRPHRAQRPEFHRARLRRPRRPLGCSDRGHTAASQLKPGDIDWDHIFGKLGVRWFHTGGIFCALSDIDARRCDRSHAIRAAPRHDHVLRS